MAVNRDLSVQPEIESLLKKLHEIDIAAVTRERQLEEQKNRDEEKIRIRKEEFDEIKTRELKILHAEKEQFQLFQKQQQHILLWEREKLAKDKERFVECQQQVAEITGSNELITIEVGNDKFKTQKGTLAKWKNSVFPESIANLRKGDHIFIDRDGKHFRFILNYMRMGEKVMRGPVSKNTDVYTLEEILAEVEYYKLDDLAKLITRKKASLERKTNFEKLLQDKYFERSNPPLKYATANEVVIKSQNLDHIVFDHVKIQHPMSFDTCTMVNARFICCTFASVIRFQNVDVHGARFENCTPIDVTKHIYFSETDDTTITYSPPV